MELYNLKKQFAREISTHEEYDERLMNEGHFHACVNNYVSYWKQNEDQEKCPQCGESRYAISKMKRVELVKNL